jgi:hypothetical protein
MKQYYLKVPIFLALFTLIFYLSNSLNAQCLCSDGSTPMTQEHVLNSTFSSNNTTTLSMPKFDPATGTLICVNAKVYLTTILKMKLENDETFPIDYIVKYVRSDEFTGPGINPPVKGSKNKSYGPYSLGASDGVAGAGADFKAIGPDTIYKKKLYEATTSDVVTYLGPGTVDFKYKSVVNTYATGSDVYGLSVSSQNRVEFRMTYSYCSMALLPLEVLDFRVTLKDRENVVLNWKIENENKNNTYEIQFSENGSEFVPVGTTASQPVDGAAAKYEYQYHLDKPAGEKLYFRIRQINGKTSKYSPIRSVRFDQFASPVRIYPNPVVRNINMEFDEPVTGEFHIELRNQVGQVVFINKTRVNNNNSLSLLLNNPPPAGIYYLRATLAETKKTYTGKLLFHR